MYDADERSVTAADGTRIAWVDHRGAPIDGRAPVVLTNGLSTTETFWRHVVAGLSTGRRVVHWSYRGHGRSAPAMSGDYSIAAHVDDLVRVTEAVGARPVHVAFSMGVTVLLELHRRRPDLVGAMVLIAGGADRPYASVGALARPVARRLVQAAVRATGAAAIPLAPVIRRITASRALFPMARATGVLRREAPREEVEAFFRAVGEMDPRAYWGTLASLLDARASDVLPAVRVPTLVIAPESDVMATRADIEAVARGIPGARFELFPGTGHAVLLEAGPEVAERIGAFLDEVRHVGADPSI